MSTDLFSDRSRSPRTGAAAAALRRGTGGCARQPAGVRGRRAEPPNRRSARKPARREHEEHHFELSANAIDLDSILGDFDEPPPPPAHAGVRGRRSRSEHRARRHQAATAPAPRPAAAAGGRPRISTASSATCATQVAKRSGLDDAEKEYKRGLALRDGGRHRRLHRGAGEGLARAEAAVRDLVADRAPVPRARHDAAGARVARARVAGAGAERRRRRIRLLYELADALEKSARSRARSRCAWSSVRRGRIPRRRRAHRSARPRSRREG